MKDILKKYCNYSNEYNGYFFNNLSLILRIDELLNGEIRVNVSFKTDDDITHYFHVFDNEIKLEMFLKSLEYEKD